MSLNVANLYVIIVTKYMETTYINSITKIIFIILVILLMQLNESTMY